MKYKTAKTINSMLIGGGGLIGAVGSAWTGSPVMFGGFTVGGVLFGQRLGQRILIKHKFHKR